MESWKAIEEAKDQGLIKSVGVSNYGQRHIEELLESKPKHKPTVNQCDLHPFMARLDLVEYCEKNDITLEVSSHSSGPHFRLYIHTDEQCLLTSINLDQKCWGPLVRAERFDHPAIVKLAKKHSVTPAQVLMYVWRSQHTAPSRLLPSNHACFCFFDNSRFSLQRGYITVRLPQLLLQLYVDMSFQLTISLPF